jgi:signal transduction histidine kinase
MGEIAPTTLLNQFFRISRLLAGQLSFRSAIRSVSNEIAAIIQHDHLDVCIVRPDGKFHTAYESGIDTDWGSQPLAPVKYSPLRTLLLGEVDFILTDDACRDPRFLFDGAFRQPILEHSLRSRIHVPMIVHGEIIGAFSCSLLQADKYSQEDVKNARYIADLLSPYFFALRAAEQAHQSAIVETEARAREEGLRLGALKLTEALEGERQRIGMDLHDQTLADLTRIVRRLERVARSGPAGAETLESISRGLHSCMQDLREIIEQAKPSVLHLFGFSQAVENHLDRALRDLDQDIKWTLQDEAAGAFDLVDPTINIALFRIAQEAINNSIKHSGATRLDVLLQKNQGQIVLTVTDNGRGISKRRTRMGSGIDNMKTRAKLISARFAIGAVHDGVGTQVSLSVPTMA